MKIKFVRIHNFRSIEDARFDMMNYSILVGGNNSGKSNIMRAIRIFYENDIKFNERDDFPKFTTRDKESWIEIEYVLNDEEFQNLPEGYGQPGNILRVRKYLKSEQRDVKSNQSNIYGYKIGKLTDSLFHGAKNVSEAKLGEVIFIPEIAQAEDAMKLSGPSPLRDLITFVMKRVIKTSESFKKLADDFDKFNKEFDAEASNDGFSLEKLKNEINQNIKEWEIEFGLKINPICPEDIIKHLVSHYTMDSNLDGEIDVKLLGQGLQRHLIYTLLKLSTKYAEARIYERRTFSPTLTLLLFEEPEAFLHPGQQEYLNNGLRAMAREEGLQILASTHSAFFVSRNIEEVSSIIKLKREKGISTVFQISEDNKDEILSANGELAKHINKIIEDTKTDPALKTKLVKKFPPGDLFRQMDEESIRYLLWLDSERCCAFFAPIVLICEGSSEKALLDYLIKNEWGDLREKRIYILDAAGKFNIHRYMNLFNELGIQHCILFDKDQDEDYHKIVNQFLVSQKNQFTKGINFFEKDIEDFLGIPPCDPGRRDKKPLNIMYHYFKKKIDTAKLTSLKKMIEALF